MRGIAAAAFALVLLLASRAAARADEPKPPPTPDEAAAEVAKAFAAKDQAGLAELAKRNEPDPWLVADALMLKGQREAADAFARAARREDVKYLPDFISTWHDTENDKAARVVLEKINAALLAKRYADALAAAETAPTGAMPYLRLRLTFGKGMALVNLGRYEQAAAIMSAVAAECTVVGWYARGVMALWQRVSAESEANRPEEALEAAEDLISLQTRRGDRAGVGMAHYFAGSLHGDAGRLEKANAALERALEAFRETGDVSRQSIVLNRAAWFEIRHGSLGQAERALKKAVALSEPAGLWSQAAESHRLMGVAQRGAGLMSHSVGSFRKALEAATKAKEDVTVARLQFDIGRGLGDVGLHDQALEPLQAAASGFEGLKPPGVWSAQLARARRAWSFAVLGRTAEARPEVERLLEAAKESKNPWVVGTVMQANARLLRAEGKRPEALKAYADAHTRLLEAGEGTQAWLATLEVAEMHREAKDLALARTTVDGAIAEAKKHHGEFLQFHAEALAARIRNEQGEKEEALNLARSAREGFRSLGEDRALKEMDAWIAELEAAVAPK